MGAWIETYEEYRRLKGKDVAPYVGAWIETNNELKILKNLLSHPTWVRGLKLQRNRCINRTCRVAPYVGAWIETRGFSLVDWGKIRSHPTWVRGLKLKSGSRTKSRNLSHPTWVRGLKPRMTAGLLINAVAPYVGAWIETRVRQTE